MSYITLNEITKETGMARTTILRRAKALNIKPASIKEGTHPGQPPKCILRSEMEDIVEFLPEVAAVKGLYKTTKEKIKDGKPTASNVPSDYGVAKNRSEGLYSRVSPYWALNSHQRTPA